MKWKEIEALCVRLRISEQLALDELQIHSRYISYLCVKLEDIADADCEAACAFLKSRFAPGELLF